MSICLSSDSTKGSTITRIYCTTYSRGRCMAYSGCFACNQTIIYCTLGDHGTGAAAAAHTILRKFRKSSLEASQGRETAGEDQGRSGEAQGSESCLPSSSKDGRWPQISNFKTDLGLIEDDLVTGQDKIWDWWKTTFWIFWSLLGSVWTLSVSVNRTSTGSVQKLPKVIRSFKRSSSISPRSSSISP